MTTIQIKCSVIPSCLHAGDFYQNLDNDDPESLIEIPSDCFVTQTEAASNVSEFRQLLLRVMEFWMLDEIPVGVLNFCDEHDVTVWKEAITEIVMPDVQKLLLDVDADKQSVPCELVLRSGRWEVIRHTLSRMAKDGNATAVAAETGNLQLLIYLHEQGFDWHKDTCSLASLNGNLQCLRYAHRNGCAWDNFTTIRAANGGQVDCLQYAHENGCPWNSTLYMVAAANGRLSCMQYAFEHGLEWHIVVSMLAALGEHLDCLQFAHENGCPWDSITTLNAAAEGKYDCLKYALENGCAVHEDAIHKASVNGHSLCVELLRQFRVL